MGEMILSSPFVHVYMIFLAAILLVVLWPAQGNSPGKEEGRGPRGSERDIGRPRTPGDRAPSLPLGRFPTTREGRARLPVRELR